MTREEQIKKATYNKYPYGSGTKGMICAMNAKFFTEGAKWADEHPFWHDLRLNENDLPDENVTDVRICYEVRDDNPMYGEPTTIRRYMNINISVTNQDWKEIFSEVKLYQGNPIAWMELPKYNKE